MRHLLRCEGGGGGGRRLGGLARTTQRRYERCDVLERCLEKTAQAKAVRMVATGQKFRGLLLPAPLTTAATHAAIYTQHASSEAKSYWARLNLAATLSYLYATRKRSRALCPSARQPLHEPDASSRPRAPPRKKKACTARYRDAVTTADDASDGGERGA